MVDRPSHLGDKYIHRSVEVRNDETYKKRENLRMVYDPRDGKKKGVQENSSNDVLLHEKIKRINDSNRMMNGANEPKGKINVGGSELPSLFPQIRKVESSKPRNIVARQSKID